MSYGDGMILLCVAIMVLLLRLPYSYIQGVYLAGIASHFKEVSKDVQKHMRPTCVYTVNIYRPVCTQQIVGNL